MDSFLDTYKNKLREKGMNETDTVFGDSWRTVISAFAKQLEHRGKDNRQSCDGDENDLVVTDVSEQGFVTEAKCRKCTKTVKITTASSSRTDKFLDTYKDILIKKNIHTFSDEDLLQAILWVVLKPVRVHHCSRGKLVRNSVKDFEVIDVSESGFVTSVQCRKCKKTTMEMQTTQTVTSLVSGHLLQTYKDKLEEKEINTFNDDEDAMQTILSAVITKFRLLGSSSETCRHNDKNELEVTDVDEHGFVAKVKCKTCHKRERITLLAPTIRIDMGEFLRTYKEMLREREIHTFNCHTATLQPVLLAVVTLLWRHCVKDQVCCNNDENDLKVTGVDGFGFVTEVKCKKCNQIMKTKCHDAKWTNERIFDESQLKPGDHICWHRPYLIWHHAIVTSVNPIKVIHYHGQLQIQETTLNEAKSSHSSCCDALYRVNYQDCYDADYTILRARKLLNENRYNLLERNCEHFSRWCKTGSKNSSQVSIFLASLGKIALMTGLRVMVLIILGFLTYPREAINENARDYKQFDTLEMWLAIFYVVMIAVVFIIYLLITSGSRLHPVSMESNDSENPSWLSELYDDCTRDASWCTRCCCCCVCCCCGLIYQALCSLCVCKHFQCKTCTCGRRPCKLACGLFWRIIIRECLAAAGVVAVIVFEQEITDWVAQWFAIWRALMFILCTALAHIVGYIIGACLGRMAEACCECHRSAQTQTRYVPLIEFA